MSCHVMSFHVMSCHGSDAHNLELELPQPILSIFSVLNLHKEVPLFYITLDADTEAVFVSLGVHHFHIATINWDLTLLIGNIWRTIYVV